ncbi:SLOG family protein [Bradyrhizobium sp. SZCCHNS3053]|uniref:SLOG family protein n=1 Tax=Bradyrhizobium sp. SZCCHNS3053 TaxID=3057322 RepID=UPI0029166A33|nr:SLOG family protein [Bradyrhizobium sp. SZCCHNS3053]
MPAPRVYNKHHKDAPDDAVYIGRGSPWGNRFVIGEHGDRDQVCNLFECEQLPDLDVSPLIGRDLVCFCAPHRCHGDSILLKANFRVVVFGGRKYADRRVLYRALDAQHGRRPITCIIEGEASGADTLAREWAESRGVAIDPYPADWGNVDRPGAAVRRNKYGKLYDALAGHVRNEKMLREGRPQLAIVCPGGNGTRDMTVRCLEYGLFPIAVESLGA